MKCDICGADYFKSTDITLEHSNGSSETAMVHRVEFDSSRVYNLCPTCFRISLIAGEICRKTLGKYDHIWPTIE